ncbi:SPFH domain-containing protein [Nocardiopsis sp. FIRDI 009]|uniref:SPFH domain-containing protein n=1 Tax=Nocardiopsis sp. FIRDI 009 TaxID=714197 RepID=UPI0018E51C5B|nr:SPFH domain-containing protein [Nocardiopsis sp. FIRDI 009]
MKRPRTVAATVTATAALTATALLLTSCSTSVNPDQVALEYNAGAFSSTEFDQCVDPGNREYYGPGDRMFVYPGGQRTFTFSGAENAEMATSTAVSSDDLELQVTGLVTFALNPDCETLRLFHEQIGLKYEAHEDAGWNEMLRDYIGQPLNRAIDDATKEYTWRELYTDPDAKSEWERRVGELTADYIAEQGGGAFFISPTFVLGEEEEPGDPQLTLQQPTPPEEVRDALTAAQEAVEQTRAQESENERIQTELEAIEALVDVLGPEGYILYQAMKNGDIDLFPVPAGGNVNITPPGN